MAAMCHDTEVDKKDVAYNCNFQPMEGANIEQINTQEYTHNYRLY